MISGANDLATPPENQAEIVAAIPGSRHEIVSSAAHFAAVEQPQAINHLIREPLS